MSRTSACALTRAASTAGRESGMSRLLRGIPPSRRTKDSSITELLSTIW